MDGTEVVLGDFIGVAVEMLVERQNTKEVGKRRREGLQLEGSKPTSSADECLEGLPVQCRENRSSHPLVRAPPFGEDRNRLFEPSNRRINVGVRDEALNSSTRSRIIFNTARETRRPRS